MLHLWDVEWLSLFLVNKRHLFIDSDGYGEVIRLIEANCMDRRTNREIDGEINRNRERHREKATDRQT